MSNCPCCGAPIDAEPIGDIRRALSPMQSEYFDRLHQTPGEWVKSEKLYSYACRRDPHGGKATAPSVTVSRTIRVLRERLTGWRIESCWRGYRLVAEAVQ